MRALLSPLFALLLLLPVAAPQASDADLLVGTWEFQDGSGRIDVRTFAADKDYMQTTRMGDENVVLSIDGSYELDGDSLVVSVESVTPQTQEIGETISFGLVAVDAKTLVLDSDGDELTGTRLSPAPSN